MSGPKGNSRDQLQRIFSIIRILLNNRLPIKSDEIVRLLANEYDITTTIRTVQRDLQTLEGLGYHISTLRGQGYLLHREDFASLIFRDSEIQALQMSRSLFSAFDGTFFKEQIDSALSLITGRIDRTLTREYMAQLSESVMVHLGPHRRLAEQNEFIDDLLSAINASWRVVISYHKPSMPTVAITVEPYRLILYHDSLFLLARKSDAAALQIFHLSRISGVEISEETFSRNDHLLDTFEERLAQSFGIFAYGEPIEARILFDASVSDAVNERVWHHSQKIKEGGDTVELTMNVLENSELVSWIVSWGKAVKALSPPSLAEKVHHYKEQI